MAITKNIFIDQGSTFSWGLTAYGPTGSVMNITAGSSGYTASGQLKRSYYAQTTTPISFVVAITGGTGGILASLGATTTAAMKTGRYVYDIDVQYPDGSIYRIVQGTATVDPAVKTF